MNKWSNSCINITENIGRPRPVMQFPSVPPTMPSQVLQLRSTLQHRRFFIHTWAQVESACMPASRSINCLQLGLNVH